jgi:hypothetical protein
MEHGKRWRILAYGEGQSVEMYSPEYAAEHKVTCARLKIPYREVPIAPVSSVFDEVVIDDWLHVEQMDDNHWWMRVGDACINVTLLDGKAVVDIERNVYD